MITPLYLLRHGPTAASLRGAPLGHLDLPVEPGGEARWPQVKAALAGFGLERVLTSDLARARLHAQDLGLPCRILPGLREQAFGLWEGVPWDDIPEARAFLDDPVRAAPPGGESFEACAARAVAALEPALEPGRATLVLAHAGSLRAILAHHLGLPTERALDLAWQPFGLTRIDRLSPGRGILRFHNQG
jgi:broad specificity phosphatase PhoE